MKNSTRDGLAAKGLFDYLYLSLDLFALCQIRTGLSSAKLFPLEELFYKHGKN